ncbi:MAG: iron ABC transporter substrate-binding protein [Anaerolineales bacterium]|nr:iron ABC transporter substrate-binding protein [Anaerolineales bacterium]
MSRTFSVLNLLLVGGLLLAACAAPAVPTAEPEAPAAPTSPEVVEVEVEVPADPGSLVIYSGRSESLVAPIIQQFADVTGINVEVRYGSTMEIAAALLEEGANSPADIFYAQDPGGIGAIEDAGLLAPIPADTLAKVAPGFSSPNGAWVGITARARIVVYNTDTLSPADLPADIRGFTDPAWNGRVGLAPTNASFVTMVTGMRQIWGEDETRAWLEGVAANNPVYYSGNGGVVTAVASGEVEVGFVNHYYLYQFLAEQGEGFAARNHYLNNGGPDSLVMVSGAGILANGANQANAQRFLDFMLSAVAQQYFASRTYEYPLVEGVATSSLLVPLAELNIPDISLGALSDMAGTAAIIEEVGMVP